MKEFFYNKKIVSFSLISLIFGIFIVGFNVHAAGWEVDVVSGILSVFIWALGLIMILVVKGLILIASYQNFIGSEAVILGWVIVRDIANMFFVVVLMIIAFGTILHVENYNYKKWLPKLILMAILINFSKTICGILIDIAQVAMMTFVNAFKDIGGANLTDMLGIAKIVKISKDSAGDISNVVGAYVLGMLYLLVAIVVIVTMAFILAMRLVMIWIYVVLSPLAYLLAAFPGGQKYSSQWWSEFTKNLIVGPVLAFFIWLSLAALGGTNDFIKTISPADISQANNQVNKEVSTDTNIKPELTTEASTPAALIKFIVGIGMLVGGLMISQEIGGAAGKIAGSGLSKIQAGQALAVGGMKSGMKKFTKSAVMTPTRYAVDSLQHETGVDLNLKRVWRKMQEKRKDMREKKYLEGQNVAKRAMESGGRIHGMLATTSNIGDAYEQSTSLRGIFKRLKGGRRMAKNKKEALAEQAQAEENLSDVQFENKWINGDRQTRLGMKKDLQEKRDGVAKKLRAERVINRGIENDLKIEEAKGPDDRDEEKIKNLREKKRSSDSRIKDLGKEAVKYNALHANKVDKIYTKDKKDEVKERLAKARDKVEQAKNKVSNNIPDYNFEAQANEQRLVSQEMAKIQNITDPTELLKMFKDAVKKHDKIMVKSIFLKMAKDGNDNEVLQPLVGDTGHKGLNNLMRQLSDKNSKNYAGFDQQEAFGLGSKIAEINKTTNHAAATAAYVMENGEWRETSDKEHNEIRDIETGKQQLQAFLRNNNRLSYGIHDANGEFHLDDGGLIKLLSIDNVDGYANMKSMNENAASYIYQAIMKDKALIKRFSKEAEPGSGSLISHLEKRLGNLTEGMDIETKMRKIKDIYGYKKAV